MAAVWGDPTIGADRFRLNAKAVSSYVLPGPFFRSLRLNPGRSRGQCERRGRELAFSPQPADLEQHDPNLIPAALTNVGQLAVERYRIVGH